MAAFTRARCGGASGRQPGAVLHTTATTAAAVGRPGLPRLHGQDGGFWLRAHFNCGGGDGGGVRNGLDFGSSGGSNAALHRVATTNFSSNGGSSDDKGCPDTSAATAAAAMATAATDSSAAAAAVGDAGQERNIGGKAAAAVGFSKGTGQPGPAARGGPAGCPCALLGGRVRGARFYDRSRLLRAPSTTTWIGLDCYRCIDLARG